MAGGGRPPAPRTPVTVVAGFLGSGKTTHINAALRHPALEGSLVVVNEFGEVGLDHALIETSSDAVILLENGCLCCTVFGDLIGTLNAVYHRRAAGEIAFERVLIETSGMADPAPVVQAFLSDPTLEGLYRLGALVTVVDAVNGEATLVDHDVAVRQVAIADTILLTKTDLASADQRASLGAVLARLNPRAPVVAAPFAPVDLARILAWQGYDPAQGAVQAARWLTALDTAGAPADDAHGHHHHRHMSIGSLSFVREAPMPRRALELLLDGIERNLGPGLLRLKAIVTVEEEAAGPAVIHGVQHLLHNVQWLDRWPFPDRHSRFVIIAAGIDTGALGEMVALLERMADRSARLTGAALSAAGPSAPVPAA
jgi:G3E family GTPase